MKLSSKIIVLLMLISFGITACLKDKNYENRLTQSVRSDGTQKVIEIGLTSTSVNKFLGLSFDATNIDTTINLIPVVLASSQTAAQDIQVTLVKNDNLVNEYNATNGTSYTIPDASKYSIIGGLTVTIPRGSNVGYLRVKFKPSDFVGSDYALGFQIANVSPSGYTISGNLNSGIVAIAIKNKYDGVYQMTGHHNRTPYDYPYDTEESLVTINGNTNAMYWNDAGSIGHPIGVGPGNQLSWYGATVAPTIVFDPATDLITNVYNSDGGGPVITMFTGAGAGVSRYDASTHKVYVYWNYNGNPLRAFFDTLVYLRPR